MPSLFLRIYATFVVSVLAFAALVALLVAAAFSSWGDERVSELVEQLDGHGPAFAHAVSTRDEAELRTIIDTLEADLDARVLVHPRMRGRRLGPPLIAPNHAGGPPPPPIHDHPLTKFETHRLRRGLPIVRRHGLGAPTVGVPLFEHGFALADEPELEEDDEHEADLQADQHGRFIALVVIEPTHDPHRRILALGVLLLVALAGGAWVLARSLTSRLAKLERSTRALAGGELSHRAEITHRGAGTSRTGAVSPEPRDEIDRLALAFNEMADRLEALLTGQRTLLANVSHELRTPIARTKVLVEILGERIESMRSAEQAGEPHGSEDLARLERGLQEMQQDIAEVEALIRDLLTSGRLELGRDRALVLEPIELGPLCEEAAARFGARVECEPALTLQGDRMLLDRMLKNLLGNARRACPDGDVVIRGKREVDALVLEVEDEGPGIDKSERSIIFEPFARLDAARDRDQGGVGLGLYLCRQIAQAHHGTIRAFGRLDGARGARFVVRLISMEGP
jgi:signal transduction histidine kinase